MQQLQGSNRRREVQEMIARSALDSAVKLKAWLTAAGRQFIAFDAQHLVDSLPWPDGVRDLMALIDRYRHYRETSLPGYPREGVDVLGNRAVALVSATDALAPAELDRLAHWAASQLLEEDPGWTFDRGFSPGYLEEQERLRKSLG